MTEINCKQCGFRYSFKGQNIPTGVKCICESKEFEKI